MIEAIHIGPDDGGALSSVESVRAFAGKGLEGDRNFREGGAKPGQAITLVEAENVEDVGLKEGATRRNVKRFTVGGVECIGVELCEPCLHLQEMTRPGIIKELVHRAGLNADILTDGVISVGDEVSTLA